MKRVYRYRIVALAIPLALFALLWACEKDLPDSPSGNGNDLTVIPYDPMPYSLPIPQDYPKMMIPSSNPLTLEGIELGRKLFYDPIMSRDSTVSCGSCHMQSQSFKDPDGISTGVDNRTGRRSSMNLINVGYNTRNLFWDGRTTNLEDQVTHPLEDPNELDHDWTSLEKQIRSHKDYPTFFRKAFGIESAGEINRELISKAIAQFERTLISSGHTRYDRALRGEVTLTEDELAGYLMFVDAVPDLPDAECGHCHAEPLFTTFEFKNNGLENIDNLEDFPDKGRGEVTGHAQDNGKFKIPTLFNVAISPPYMHDGRFETLDEVMDHYNSGGHRQSNTDPLIQPLGLTEKQKQQVIAFVKTLTDSTFLNEIKFSNPTN